MLDEKASGEECAGPQNRIYGKFQGTVKDNKDPLKMGHLRALVPRVLGETLTGWAKPCVPYAGPTSGFFSVPPVDAGVWIEFEAGDVSLPIWSGCYWGAGEVPMKPPGEASEPTTRIWRTEKGLTTVMDDAAQTITLSDAKAENSVEVSTETGIVTIKGKNQVVLHAPKIREGSIEAGQRAVLGDNLLTYLNQLVKVFNAHLHSVEFALGIFPVTPAPSVTPMPQPLEQFLLSDKVKLE